MAAAVAPHPGFLSLDASNFLESGWFFQPLVGQLKAMAEVGGSARHDHGAEQALFPLADGFTSPVAPSCLYEDCTTPSSTTSESDHSECFSDLSRSSSSNSSSSHTCRTCLPNGSRRDYSPAEMRQVFDKLDENEDGFICCKDLQRFMRRLGFELSNEEVVSLVKSIDLNEDNTVDFEEFCSLYKTLSSQEEEEKEVDEADHGEEADTILEAFRVFDKNQDGRITPQELQEVLSDLGFPEGKSLKKCERMIARVDSDGNGEIDISEFMSLMCSNCFQC